MIHLMGNPNPFYRFKPAWNYGFYPDNVTTTQLLAEIYQAITLAYPGWVTIGTTTLGQLQGIVSNLVNPYNAYPYYGGMSVIMDAVPAGPVYNWTLIVRNNDLYVVDSTQEITISGTATNPGKVISTSALNAFTIASYSGTYSPTLINEEIKIQEALECVDLNGSAIFPITYKYDPSLGVARSGLARGMDWQLSNGAINRLPIETTPRQNRRTFELPQLTGDDTYVLSIMERIIQGAFTYVDFNYSILPVYNSFTPPDGWTFSYNYPSFTTYERVQFNFVDSSRRKFILVGRRIASTYLWQRFVSDSYLTPPYDFLSVYTETTALPYEPNQAGRWLYNNDTYDFEFVDFTSGCYESGEFYPMPAKPGDQLQFNIIDANLTGIDNVSIGLFEEDGTFVQKIGDASKLSYACGETTVEGTQYKGQVTIPSKQGCHRMGLYYLETGGEPPAETCELTLTKYLDDSQDVYPEPPQQANFDDFIANFTAIGSSLIPFIGIKITNGTTYVFDATGATLATIFAWLNTIPGIRAEYEFPTATAYIRWTKTVNCDDTVYEMTMFQCDSEGTPMGEIGQLWIQSNGTCACTPNAKIWQWYWNQYGDTYFPDFNANPNKYVKLYVQNQTTMVRTIVQSIIVSDLLQVGLYTWANSIQGLFIDKTYEYSSYLYDVPCDGNEYLYGIGFYAEDGTTWIQDLIIADVTNYKGPVSCTDYCTQTFTYTITGEDPYEWFTNLCNDLDAVYVSISIYDGTKNYATFTTPWPCGTISPDNMHIFFNGIPGMTFTQTETSVTWTWDYQVPCDGSYTMRLDGIGTGFQKDFPVFETLPLTCTCVDPPAPGQVISYLYSLSNIINIDRADCFSTILEYWADSNAIAQGNEYYSDWKQRVRIGLNGGGEKPIIEESLYRQSNGVHRRPQNKQDLSVDLHTDFFDLKTQLAMTDATRHPNLVWEGKSIFVKGDIEVATTQDFTTQTSFETLSQMKFQALIQGFQPRNSSCLTC